MAYLQKITGGYATRRLPVFFSALWALLLLNGCGALATRPSRPLSYAEAAYQAAQKADAEGRAPQSFQLARETLFRARSAYRLKNFRQARKLAVRARLLAEEAEFRSIHKDAAPESSGGPPPSGPHDPGLEE